MVAIQNFGSMVEKRFDKSPCECVVRILDWPGSEQAAIWPDDPNAKALITHDLAVSVYGNGWM